MKLLLLIMLAFLPVQEPSNAERLIREGINPQVRATMRGAWIHAQGGTNKEIEILILVYKKSDGTLFGVRQTKPCRRFHCEFSYTGDVVAIFHTHPNFVDPRPSILDRTAADKTGLPVVTLSSSGMYLYDPATKKTTQLSKALDWLKQE